MATDYPIEIDDVGGGVRIAGIANFTDPSNQPQPGGSTIDVSQIDATGITDGFVVTAEGEAATWAAPPAGGNGSLQAKINAGSVFLGGAGLGQASPLPSNSTTALSIQGPFLATVAMGSPCAVQLAAPADVPDISDSLDTSATLYVTDAAGTNTLLATAGGSQTTPIAGIGASIDWTTGPDPTIVGVDLSWDAATATVTSAAGGIYQSTLVVSCGPD